MTGWAYVLMSGWMSGWMGRWMSGGMNMLRAGKKWSWSIFLCSCRWNMFCYSASVMWPVHWLCSSICSYLTLMPPLPDQQTTWRAALQCLTRAPACFLGSRSWMTFWPTMSLFRKCTSSCPPSSSSHHSQSWLMDPEYVLGTPQGRRAILDFSDSVWLWLFPKILYPSTSSYWNYVWRFSFLAPPR